VSGNWEKTGTGKRTGKKNREREIKIGERRVEFQDSGKNEFTIDGKWKEEQKKKIKTKNDISGVSGYGNDTCLGKQDWYIESI